MSSLENGNNAVMGLLSANNGPIQTDKKLTSVQRHGHFETGESSQMDCSDAHQSISNCRAAYALDVGNVPNSVNELKLPECSERVVGGSHEMSTLQGEEDSLNKQVDNGNASRAELLHRSGTILKDLLSVGTDMNEAETAVSTLNKNEEAAATPDDLPLTQSPLVTTPPYEYIMLSKGNEHKFRIFLNPRVNQIFQDELAKSIASEEFQCDELIKPNSVEGDNDVNACMSDHIAVSRSLLRAVRSEPTIHCFDPSEVDVELKQLFLIHPPVINKIVRKKSRKERGSSVPAVDSYYGTKDLEKVGHASYFIPELTISERKSVGWKDHYKYGNWKYSTPNIPRATSGHIPLNAGHSTILKTNNNAWWRSPSSRGFLHLMDSTSTPVHSNHTFILPYLMSTEDDVDAMDTEFGPFHENANPSLETLVGSKQSLHETSCLLQQVKTVGKFFRRCFLVPGSCIIRLRKGKTKPNDNEHQWLDDGFLAYESIATAATPLWKEERNDGDRFNSAHHMN